MTAVRTDSGSLVRTVPIPPLASRAMAAPVIVPLLSMFPPECVAIVTFAGTMIGSVSVGSSDTVWPFCPTMMICVPGTANPPTTCSACDTVRKLQLGIATLPTLPLPVAVASSPLIGST